MSLPTVKKANDLSVVDHVALGVIGVCITLLVANVITDIIHLINSMVV